MLVLHIILVTSLLRKIRGGFCLVFWFFFVCLLSLQVNGENLVMKIISTSNSSKKSSMLFFTTEKEEPRTL